MHHAHIQAAGWDRREEATVIQITLDTENFERVIQKMIERGDATEETLRVVRASIVIKGPVSSSGGSELRYTVGLEGPILSTMR